MSIDTVFDQWLDREIEKYVTRTRRSAMVYEKAAISLPGGDTRTVTFYRPYPVFIDKGEGCRIWDIDGNAYLDFLNNYTVLVHGHAYPPIVKAIEEQAKKGVSFAGPTQTQQILAGLICERIKSVVIKLFCNLMSIFPSSFSTMNE